jgi:hypothetical protein
MSAECIRRSQSRQRWKLASQITSGALKKSLDFWKAINGVSEEITFAIVGFNVAAKRDRLFGGSTPQIRSLAVLPLENLSGKSDEEFLPALGG